MEDYAGLELRSLVTPAGTLELSLVDIPVVPPGEGQVLVRMQAAPINPSDLGLLLGGLYGGAEMGTARSTGTADRPVTTAMLPPSLMGSLAARVGQSMPVGNEGAGLVVAAGAAPEAQALLGRTVAVLGGAMYTRFRTVPVGNTLALPEGASAADGASCFVNPLTALGMVETMRAEGHAALVHTAAASNLGQMLNRICLDEGIGLVAVVRSPAQVALLRGQGAAHVCDSSAADFTQGLTHAIAATGATLAFDAVGGGALADQILHAMEDAANETATEYSRYGSATHKQVYIYGALDTGPTALSRSFGFAWGVGGWLLTPFLQKVGGARVAAMKARVAAELHTTFASRYTRTISLAQALDPAVIAAYAQRATGEKYLIDPSL
jgi:NADPH2:quinone reductase